MAVARSSPFWRCQTPDHRGKRNQRPRLRESHRRPQSLFAKHPHPQDLVVSSTVSFAFPPCVALTFAFTYCVAIPSIGSPRASVSRTAVVSAPHTVVRSMRLTLCSTPPHCIPIAIARTTSVAVVVAKDDEGAGQVPL